MRLHSFIIVMAFVVVGCGSSSQGSAGTGAVGNAASDSFPCPNLGDKVCPNDHPTSQAEIDLCNSCHAEWSALGSCGAQTNPTPSCGPDGKKSGPIPDNCDAPLGAYLRCAFATVGNDAG